MIPVHANRLLPLLGAVVGLMAAFVALRACAPGGESEAAMSAVPRAPAPDADTPAETIRTLTARVADMTAQSAALRKENEALLRRDRALRESITAQVRHEIAAEQARRPAREDTGVLDGLSRRLEALSTRVTGLTEGLHTRTPAGALPVGEGWPGDAPETLVWNEPLHGPAGTVTPASHASGAGGEAPLPLTVPTAAPEEAPAAAPLPYYTVPRNATLIGSTAMTALIGRIPIRGQVQDPMPFKVIVGHENLAANGLTVPGVDGMIWSGTALGDWTLSCVTGRLEAVTFVFADGTIRTIAAEAGGTPLGWISDDQGIPCISGQRITNAPAFLGQRLATLALQAGAEAAAASQTTRSVSNLTGVGTTTVSGEVGGYVLGRAVAGGAAELRQWLDERQAQSFDAVFVRAGVKLAVHVDRELPIDYDPHGRRLRHDPATAGSARRVRLD